VYYVQLKLCASRFTDGVTCGIRYSSITVVASSSTGIKVVLMAIWPFASLSIPEFKSLSIVNPQNLQTYIL